MDASKISESRNVTQGQVKRTLRGMDGRIRHIETLAARWETRKIEETVAAAVEAATKRIVESFTAQVSALTARVVALEPKPVVEDAPV